ncbi:hypothetical protein ACHHYP_20328 [Achlya hypogyna]|uniref:Uncharacterized protein n=1 Tax=Achlya hypogyna TaxID=1202772 RepID=A0A1V9ZLV0_ACHHY|nr:hypothetical protein ACHHYP_20328 [Achlya hypogyna]
MFAVDPEYAEDDIELHLAFDGAIVEESDADVDVQERAQSPYELVADAQSVSAAISHLKSIVTPTALQHLEALLDHIAQLEDANAALQRQKTTQDAEMRSLRQLYHGSVQENEALALQLEQATTKKSSPPAPVAHSSLQELMEMDMKVHQMTKDKDKLAAENERVTALCAKFQQEVMWKTLDLSDNERSLQRLEWALAAEKTKSQDKEQEVADMRSKALALEEHNATLLKHKKVLVTEVKALQKYSHVNITALVQDAAEARMMQKSLADKLAEAQAERDALKESLNALSISSLDAPACCLSSDAALPS